MQSVPSFPRRQAALFVLLLLLALRPLPGVAQSLFASHEVTVEFANAAGKPLADAEVRVFAPGRPDHPALTGHTDSKGHFRFPADRDGFWTAEAKEGGEIARVMIRVGSGKGEAAEPLSPYWAIGGLVLLLVLAFFYHLARRRLRRPPRG